MNQIQTYLKRKIFFVRGGKGRVCATISKGAKSRAERKSLEKKKGERQTTTTEEEGATTKKRGKRRRMADRDKRIPFSPSFLNSYH